MDAKYDSLLNKNIHYAEVFIQRRGFKKAIFEYCIILIIILGLLGLSYIIKDFGRIKLVNTDIDLFIVFIKFLPLIILFYIWWKHKFSFADILSLFGLYDVNIKRTINGIIIYLVLILSLVLLFTTIFMNAPLVISSKLAIAANDKTLVMNWLEPLQKVTKEFAKQAYEVAFLEELLFRGIVQYFSFFLLLYFFRNVFRFNGKIINQSLGLLFASLISIGTSIIVFILFHMPYLRDSLRISSSMYYVTIIIYVMGVLFLQ